MSLSDITENIEFLSKSTDWEINAEIDELDNERWPKIIIESEKKKYFCVEDTFLSDEISVSIAEVGNLDCPIEETVIKKLLNISSKAVFGFEDETILDMNIDTQTISPNKLCVEINPNSLRQVLNRIGLGLNFDDTSKLDIHLHNLLVYGPGQFFKAHRDSEKMSNMVGTLVIVLPCKHEGGDLIIDHMKESHEFFASQNPNYIKCIAFYADCKHEITQVKVGHRVALTYNIVLNSPNIKDIIPNNVDVALNNAVLKFFSTSVEGRNNPRLLAFMMNHKYTEYGLRWNMIKGIDRTIAHALYAIAKRQGRKPCLALAEIQETRSEDEVDRDISLYFWIDDENLKFILPKEFIDEKKLFTLNINEICTIAATSNVCEAIDNEFHFYGNNAAEISYWYRRGCVVVWK